MTEHHLDHEHDYPHIAKSRSSQGKFVLIRLVKTEGDPISCSDLEGNKRFVRHPTRLAGLYLSRKGDELKSPLSPLSLSNPANWGRAGRRGAGRQRRGHCIMLLQSLSGRRRRASERRGGIKVWARSRNPPLPLLRARASFSPEGPSYPCRNRGERAQCEEQWGADGWIGSSGFGQMSAKPEGRSGGRVDRPGTSQRFADATLRALFTLGPSEHGPAAQVRQRLPS